MYIHLSYEDFKPMVMIEKIEEDDDVGGGGGPTPLKFTGGRKKGLDIKSGETSIKKSKSKTPKQSNAALEEPDFKRGRA